jgi:serine/threonine protein kinase
LVDFGVAKAIDRISEKTRTGHLKGKFGYMSPEQVRGLPVDRRSDVFSLGIVLYELTTGQRLFRGINEIETLRLVARGRVPRPTFLDAHYPVDLERIVLKALANDVAERYSSARDFESDLSRFLQTHNVLVPRSGVAGLLERVIGPRIEQKRNAVRRNLSSHQRSKDVTQRDLSPGRAGVLAAESEAPKAQDFAVDSNVSNVSLSQLSPLTRPSRPDVRNDWRRTLLFAAVGVVAGYWVYGDRAQTRVSASGAPQVAAPPAAAGSASPAGSGEVIDTSSWSTAEAATSPRPRPPLLRVDELELEAEGAPAAAAGDKP